jgi:probable phosphoglycerate mutase
VEASFALAFGLGASGNRVACAPLNTSLTHWRHRLAPAGEPTWTLVSFNDANHLVNSPLRASPPHRAVPLSGEGRTADM